MFVLLYASACLLVGWLASLRGHNIVVYTLLSIIATPIIGLIVLFFLVPPRDVGRRTVRVSCPSCNHALKHLKSIEYCSHCGEAL